MNDINKPITTRVDENQRLWIDLNSVDPNCGLLSHTELDALQECLTTLDHTVSALILNIQTARPQLDVMFRTLITQQETAPLLKWIRQAQTLCQQLEKLPVPSLTLIHTPCFSYELELALSTDYCIALDDPTLLVGFPETRFGLHPALGGVQKALARTGPGLLPSLIEGSSLSVQQAAHLGLIDACVSTEQLASRIDHYLQHKPSRQRRDFQQTLLNLPLLRSWHSLPFSSQLRRNARPDHHPAAYALLNLWRRYGSRTDAKAMDHYARSVADLSMTEQAQNRLHLQQSRRQLCGKCSTDHHEVRHIHVIGTGLMAQDIVTYCAGLGLHISIQDKRPEAWKPCGKRCARICCIAITAMNKPLPRSCRC
ncbi:MAG: enoyl-CoA hydratase-related protein [Thiolinea sp.]